jgi:long-chain acyl-CoA synthetase
MQGYYNNPILTGEALQNGWFFTGDYGYINDDDQLVITGRRKNIIVLSNGKNVYPEEIEGYIQGIDYITEVLVYPSKNEAGVETSLYAEVYIEGADKTPQEVLASIRKACKHLPKYKQISKVVIRSSEFSKTSSNKIKRKP